MLYIMLYVNRKFIYETIVYFTCITEEESHILIVEQLIVNTTVSIANANIKSKKHTILYTIRFYSYLSLFKNKRVKTCTSD
jgi:hypothetical protein